MQLGDPLVSKLPEPSSLLRNTFSFNVGSLNLRPEYWQAFTIVVLTFLIVFSIARWRHLYVKWNLQGFLPSVMFGFILTLAVEGFFLISGRTILTEIIGWENAPKPISTALDKGRSRLVNVLGVSEEIPDAVAEGAPTYDEVLIDYELLSEVEADQVKKIICEQ